MSWEGRSQGSAEKSQGMTAALEKMPWSRAARTQSIDWMKQTVMSDLVMVWKSLTHGDSNATVNGSLQFSIYKY